MKWWQKKVLNELKLSRLAKLEMEDEVEEEPPYDNPDGVCDNCGTETVAPSDPAETGLISSTGHEYCSIACRKEAEGQ